MCASTVLYILYDYVHVPVRLPVQQERRLFTNFHRQLFCWTDKWHDLTMADIRRLEEQTREKLNEVLLICKQVLAYAGTQHTDRACTHALCVWLCVCVRVRVCE